MFFRSFARNNARQCLWEIIPYLECHTIAKPSGREIESACLLHLLAGEIHGGSFAVVNLCLESFWRVIFALISDQDVKEKIGCRWELL